MLDSGRTWPSILSTAARLIENCSFMRLLQSWGCLSVAINRFCAALNIHRQQAVLPRRRYRSVDQLGAA
jgi:hypothetical protein